MLLPFRPRRKPDFEPIIRKPIANLRGLDFSLPPDKMPDEALSNCKNVWIQDGEIKPRFGYETFGRNLPLTGSIMGFAQFYKYDATPYLVCFTTTNAYKYNTDTTDWEDITDGAGDYTGAVTDPFFTEMMYDDNAGEMKFLSTNRTDAVKKWTGANNWDDLGGSPNKCKFLKNFYHHLMLFDVVDGTRFPQRVDWSDIGEPEDWSGGSSGSNNLARTADFIVGAEFIKGQLAIFKEKSICMCRYVGGADPYEFDEKRIVGTGLMSITAITSLLDQIIFLDSDLNVSLFDGFGITPVSANIHNKLIDSINPEKVELCHIYAIDELNLILLFAPKPGSSYPDSIWVWNYKDNNWFYWELAQEILSTGYYQSDTSLQIGQLLDKIGTFNWRIGSRALYTSFPYSLIGDEDGYIYKFSEALINDNDATIISEFNTKSYFLGGLEQFVRGNNFSIYGKGDTVDLYVSDDDGAKFTFQDTVILDKDKSNLAFGRGLEHTSEKMMFKVKNETLNNTFAIRGWNPSVTMKGKKRKHTYLNQVISNAGNDVEYEDVRGRRQKVYSRR